MSIFVLLLLLIALYKSKVSLNGDFYSDYLSVEQTRSVNGIFIMLILFSHTFARVSPQSIFDSWYTPFRVFLGQFVVVPILFYSGYGIMESLKNKSSYLKSFPKKRFLKLLVRFAIITVIYIIIHLCLGTDYSLKHILLSFIGITSIGNGGWYMFSTFVFYLSIILCFNLFRKNKFIPTVAVAFCLVVLMLVEIVLRFPTYYYNTTIFFAVGMFYSLFKKYFDKIIMKNNFVWAVFLVLSILGFIFVKGFVDISVLFYPIWCGFGMLMILCLTMKIKLQNKILIWLGKTIFFIFTLQGIPQILFTKFLNNNYFIYILTTAITLLLAYVADYLFLKSENVFNNKSIRFVANNKE